MTDIPAGMQRTGSWVTLRGQQDQEIPMLSYLYQDELGNPEIEAGVHMDEATTRRYMDERYEDLMRRGFRSVEAAYKVREEAIALGHTCYESIIGPYCPVCDRDMP